MLSGEAADPVARPTGPACRPNNSGPAGKRARGLHESDRRPGLYWTIRETSPFVRMLPEGLTCGLRIYEDLPGRLRLYGKQWTPLKWYPSQKTGEVYLERFKFHMTVM